MSLILTVPTHLDGRNPIVGRYTARELVPVVAGVFAAAGMLGQPHLPLPVRIGEALAVALLGCVAGLVRPGGRSLAAWGRLAAAHLLDERTHTWAPLSSRATDTPDAAPLRPPHLAPALGMEAPAPLPPPPPVAPGAPSRPTRRPATQDRPFVPAAIIDETIVFSDGSRCAVLECSGAAVAGLDEKQQRALHTAYHAVLLGLSFPVQVLLCADPIDPGPYAARRTARLAGRPLAVRRLGSADAAYMRRALAQAGALDQHVYVVLLDVAWPTPQNPAGTGLLALLRSRRRAPGARERGVVAEQGENTPSRVVAERCEALCEALAQAGVHTWRLDTPALQRLYYGRLCPRTARLQPFDPGHVSPVAAARVLFDRAPLTDDGETTSEDGEEGDDAPDAASA